MSQKQRLSIRESIVTRCAYAQGRVKRLSPSRGSLLPRPHPLINLQLPREGLVTLATKTVASTSQNREVASRLQRANPSRHYCLTYNVTVLIRKFTKPAQVLLLHKLLFRSVVACLSSTRMLLARQQTSENEQTKAYVRTTVIGMGGASRNHRYKKFSRATVFVASVTRPSKLYCFNRGVWPGEEASPEEVRHGHLNDPIKLHNFVT